MGKAERPKQLQETTVRIMTGCGKMYVTITEHSSKPFEVFVALGKAGGCPKCYSEAVSRCISLGLRYGIPASDFIEQLKDLKCPNQAIEDSVRITSCPDAIAKAMDMEK